MKITKKAFIENMTINDTAFIGVCKKLYTSDELFCKIQDLFNDNIILEKRTCIAHSNSLEFSGGSYLYFDQKAKYSFYEYTYPNGKVYICCYEWYDDFDEVNRTKAMYYLVKH